jgi:hypothetical protein
VSPARDEIGEPAVGNLDAQELEVVVAVRARDAVRAQQRAPVDFETDHREVAAFEAKAPIA